MSQIILGGRALSLTTGTFWNFDGPTTTGHASHALASQVIPAAGVLKNFYIKLTSGNPGAGNSWIFTIYVNNATTGISVTISDTNTTGQDITNSFTVAAGDTISVAITSTGSPDTSNPSWNCQFNPSVADNTILMGTTGTGNIADARFSHLVGNAGVSATENQVQQVIPVAGTIKSLYVILDGAPGASTSWVLTIRNGGTNKLVTVTISGTDTTGNDVANMVSVAAGDVVSIGIAIGSGSPTASVMRWGMVFVPAISGHFIFMQSSQTSYTGGTTTDYALPNAQLAHNTTESQRRMVFPVLNIKAIYAWLASAPGAGKSYVFTVRRTGVDTGLTTTIADADTAMSASGNISIANGDLIGTSIVPAGSPAAILGKISYLATIGGSFGPFGGSIFNSEQFGQNPFGQAPFNS